MSVFTDLFTPSKTDFPEQQQLIENWTASLENFKKQIKYLGGFLLELIVGFDQYGKQILKSGKTLLSNLNKLSTQNSKNLSDCIKSCGSFSEMLGGVYSRSSLALNSSISQKLGKIAETLIEIKKSINDESGHAMKELAQAKVSHLKIKVKYEKAKKEHESILANTKKIQNDPANSYQPMIIQRAKERTKASKKEIGNILKNLNEQVEIIHQKNDILENLLSNLHSNTLNFEKDSIQLLHEILKSVLQMLQNIIALRQEQTLLKQEQLNGLANITLDMVGGKEVENNTNTLEYLSIKLETRVTSCEDRLKVLKCFRSYIGELIQCEENFSKALEKNVKNFVLPEYFECKQLTKSSWENFSKSLLEICKIHTEQAKEMNKKAHDPVIILVNSQGNLSRNLQIIVQKIMKDHALTHEECLREFEKLKRGPEDLNFQKRTLEIREKMQNSNQITENLVLTSLADNSNQEVGHLQVLKASLIHIYTMEDALNASLSSIIGPSFKFLQVINTNEDFNNIQTYNRKTLPLYGSFGDVSFTSESIEGEEDKEALSEDNVLQRFGLKSSTSMIESFSCALSQKLLLHGRMYLTTTHICFHSYFNSTTIFGRETLISIPLSEIINIEKRTSALIFDNALCIITNSSNFVFKSFMYREQAFATVENLLKMNKPVSQIQNTFCEFIIENRKHRRDIQKILHKAKIDDFTNLMVSSAILKNKLTDAPIILELPLQQVFLHCFSDDSDSFLMNYLQIQENTEIVISKWSPNPPSFYLGLTDDK